ncbi:MAG: nucleoside-diphosphate-sugar epimerase [Hyphomicrobiales bacterium]|nr:nucleoside-diphosphate-sugar epimerase [Hyphomicrobiales bacterium]
MSVDFSKPILVTGASGKTGRAVIGNLVKAGAQVRAFVRRAEAGDELVAAGAREFFLGDLQDAAALRQAVSGVEQVIHISPPMHPAEDEITQRLIGDCVQESVARLVLYSVLHPAVDVPHHQRKARAELALIDSGLPYTILQPCRYMQHLLPIWKQVVENGVHAMPFGVDAKFSLVDMKDLAEAASRVLTQGGHEFATYQLCGPQLLSQRDCAQILSAYLGREVRAEEKSLDAFRAEAEKSGMPDWRIATMTKMNAHYGAHGLIGNPNVLRWVLGREPTTFESFVASQFPRA